MKSVTLPLASRSTRLLDEPAAIIVNPTANLIEELAIAQAINPIATIKFIDVNIIGEKW